MVGYREEQLWREEQITVRPTIPSCAYAQRKGNEYAADLCHICYNTLPDSQDMGPAKLSVSRQMTKENVYVAVEYHPVIKKIETLSCGATQMELC